MDVGESDGQEVEVETMAFLNVVGSSGERQQAMSGLPGPATVTEQSAGSELDINLTRVPAKFTEDEKLVKGSVVYAEYA